MTLIEPINKVDALKHNTYSLVEKVEWLSTLDLMVKTQILDNCEGHPAPDFAGYTESTPLNTVLLVPAPFDAMYLRWLEAQIDYYNGENERYNDAIRLFEDLYGAYANHYRRNHRPCNAGNRFLF
jgi:hypothetical protein